MSEREALRAIASGPAQMLEYMMEKGVDVPTPITPGILAMAIAADALKTRDAQPEPWCSGCQQHHAITRPAPGRMDPLGCINWQAAQPEPHP